VLIHLLNHEASGRARVVGGYARFSNSSDSSIEEKSVSSLDFDGGTLGGLCFPSFPDHYHYVLHLREGTPNLLVLLHAPGFNRNRACQDEGNTSMGQLLIDVGADITSADLLQCLLLPRLTLHVPPLQTRL